MLIQALHFLFLRHFSFLFFSFRSLLILPFFCHSPPVSGYWCGDLRLYAKQQSIRTHVYFIYLIYIQVSQEECARLREGVPYVKVYRYNPKHLCPNLNGYGDNGQRSLKL